MTIIRWLFTLQPVGHARTFWIAQQRAKAAGGHLVLRIEDLDGPRCKQHYLDDMLEDLEWFGFEWDLGPPNTCYSKKSQDSSLMCRGNNKEKEGVNSTNLSFVNPDKPIGFVSHKRRISSEDIEIIVPSSTDDANGMTMSRLPMMPNFCGELLKPYLEPVFVCQQSSRIPLYLAAWRRLKQLGLIYPRYYHDSLTIDAF